MYKHINASAYTFLYESNTFCPHFIGSCGALSDILLANKGLNLLRIPDYNALKYVRHIEIIRASLVTEKHAQQFTHYSLRTITICARDIYFIKFSGGHPMPLPKFCGEPMKRVDRKPEELLTNFMINMARRFPEADITIKLKVYFRGRGYFQNDTEAVIVISTPPSCHSSFDSHSGAANLCPSLPS